MFRSKRRPLIIPQLEHSRMAGHIAHHWGNETVSSPPIDTNSFVLGVTDHDRGYDPLDTMGIGEVDEALWLATQKRGLLRENPNPIADAVALMHIHRLLQPAASDAEIEVVALADQRIERTITQTSHTRTDFARADTITHVCDMISFIFCFEEPKQLTKSVYSDGDKIDIHINLLADGTITLVPYPLSVPELRGFVLGYETRGYPDHPRPVLVGYTITSLL